MSFVKKYLKYNSFQKLIGTYDLYAGYHNKYPLVVLNYHPHKSKKNDPLVEQCRGVVLELDSWDIIALGMPRFYNNGEKGVINKFDFKNIIRCEHKEDGTLLHLFCYKNNWILSTRYNFCEDFLGDITYQKLFESIVGLNLDEMGKYLNPNITYCLEMCSKTNAIIKLYDKPSVYLLAAFENQKEYQKEIQKEIQKELSYDIVDQIVENTKDKINWLRPICYKNISSKDIYKLMENICEKDPSFEGFVLIDKNGNRIKIKSDLYNIIHSFKYRGWISATEKTFIPLIENGNIEYVFEVLSFYRNPIEIKEFRRRFELIKYNYDNGIKTKGNLFINLEHPREYCRLKEENIPNDEELKRSEIAKVPPKLLCKKAINNDYQWDVTCYCGGKMDLIKLKYDFLQYKICHCGSNFDIKKYPAGTNLYICLQCNLTHEAHQKEIIFKSGEKVLKGQPTGIPSSDKCKNMRLFIHQIINTIMKKYKIDKNAVYDQISKILNCERKLAHIGRLDIRECYKVAIILQGITEIDSNSENYKNLFSVISG